MNYLNNLITRRRFLRQGSTLVASGLVIPVAPAAWGKPSNGTQEGSAAPKNPAQTTPQVGNPELPRAASAEELKRFLEPSGDLPKWHGWWSNNLLRADFDMLYTDARPDIYSKLNADEIASILADAGLQSLWGYVQDPTGWLFYPSKVGSQHPRLIGRDLVAEYIAACRKYNLKFFGYYDPWEMGVPVTQHPEWRTELVGDTVPSSPRLWGNLCFNRPGAWDYYLAIVRESLTNYEMDSVWFDDFWVRRCGCADCQKRYRNETGRELPFYATPQAVNYPAGLSFGRDYPEGPEFGLYFRHIESWLNQWAMDLWRAVKEIRPDCVVVIQYHSYNAGGEAGYTVDITKAVDVTTSDSAALGFQYQHSLVFKSVRGFTRNMPFDIEMDISEHHGHEVSPKMEGILKQQFAYILAHGGAISYIDDMDWQGRISKKKYQRCKHVNAWVRERFPYLGGALVADVGLYFSHESNLYHPKWQHYRWRAVRADAERGKEFSYHDSGNVALVQAMIRENIPFDILHRNKLQDLGRHKVMYVSNVEVLSDQEAEALRDFVKEGGGLVVTYRTGMRDADYQERQNFPLADLMGVDYLEVPDIASSFVVVDAEDRAEGFFAQVDSEMPYFEVHMPSCYVKPREGTRRLGKVGRPVRPYNEDEFYRQGLPPVMQLIDPKEIRQNSAGHMYSPEIVTDHPAVVLNQYAKGRVAYFAAVPSFDYVDDLHDLIMSLLNWAAGGKLNPTVLSNAPAPVEILTLEQLSNHRTVIHAINWAPSWPSVRAHDVEVSLRTFGRKAKKISAIEAKQDVPVLSSADRLRVTFPPFETWETVVVEWK
jgi:hypothetical protein